MLVSKVKKAILVISCTVLYLKDSKQGLYGCIKVWRRSVILEIERSSEELHAEEGEDEDEQKQKKQQRHNWR